jgi:hypothetical protein
MPTTMASQPAISSAAPTTIQQQQQQQQSAAAGKPGAQPNQGVLDAVKKVGI